MPLVSSTYADIYDRLMTVIETSQGRLGILIAVCDSWSLREETIRNYEQEARQAQIQPYRLQLSRGSSIRGQLIELRQAHSHLQQGGAAVVTVTGAELLLGYNMVAEDAQKTPLDEFFGYLQWTREGLQEFNFPIVLWLNRRLLKEISFKAPDFWSWRKGVFWFVATGDMPPEFMNIRARDTESLVSIGSDEFLPPLEEVQQDIDQLEATEPNSPNLAILYERLGDIYQQRIQQGVSPDPQQDANQVCRALRQALLHYRRQENFASQVVALQKLGNFLLYLSLSSEALEVYQEMLSITRQTANRSAEADALFGLGKASDKLGLQFLDQREAALENYGQALEMYRSVGDRLGEANTLQAIGDVQQFLKQCEAALENYGQALEMYRSVGARLGEANTLKAIGDVQQFLDQREAALENYGQALAMYRSVGDRLGEANTLQAIGDVQQFLKQCEAALENYGQALEMYRSVGDRLGEANTLQAIGDVQQFLKQCEAALENYGQALEMYRSVGARLGEANTLKAIGDVQQFLKQCEAALENYGQALAMYRSVGARLGEANTLKAIGDVQENPEERMVYLQSAMELYQAVGDLYSQGRLLVLSLAPTLHQQGQTAAAIKAFEQAAEIGRKIDFAPLTDYALERIAEL